MPKLQICDMSDEQLRAEVEQLRPRLEAADRIAAPFFAMQLAENTSWGRGVNDINAKELDPD